MKLIEGMKLIKELQIKADALRTKVKNHCADLDFETPAYANQKEQVAQWIQSHSDVLKEILKLRHQIRKTNIATLVSIELGGKKVEKTIAEWIDRRRDLAKFEETMWAHLTDRGLKEGQVIPSTVPGGTGTPVKLRRYFDALERDNAIELYRAEPGIIDRTLEVVNATTELAS